MMNMRKSRGRPLAVLALASLCTAVLFGSAQASNGVLEINQSCVAAGCFAGDEPGFPVELTSSGSYQLTSNLTVPDADTTAILVRVSATTIDLNGFAILGVTDCDFVADVCTNGGDGHGIAANLGGVEGVIVKNGTVRGMGSIGINLSSGGIIDGVTAVSNGFTGLQTDQGVITNSTVYRNGAFGIQASYSVVRDVSAARNLGPGIRGGFGLQVVSSTASFNRGPGLDLPLASGFGAPGSYEGCNLQSNSFPTGSPEVVGGLRIGSSVCGNGYCP